jgi:hypothetical protein
MNFAVQTATEFDDDPELLFVPGTSHEGFELIEVLVDSALSLVKAVALQAQDGSGGFVGREEILDECDAKRGPIRIVIASIGLGVLDEVACKIAGASAFHVGQDPEDLGLVVRKVAPAQAHVQRAGLEEVASLGSVAVEV